MLFSRKVNIQSLPRLSFTKISKQQFIFDQFILDKIFIVNNKQIQISLLKYEAANASDYLGLHTEYGIFYLENGLQWLQGLTGIYIENEDEDTQNWLISCALERLEPNVFPINIISLSLHYYVNIKKLHAIHLIGLYKNNLYATQENWIHFFKQQKFIKYQKYDVNNILLDKNIILGRQTLYYKQYQQLTCGNVILVNQPKFDIEGIGIFNIGSFAVKIAYENGNLTFIEWVQAMKEKEENDEWNFDDNVDNLDEYNTKEEQLEQENESSNEIEDLEESLPESDEDSEQQLVQEQNHPFADVPININFSLGQLKLPISEIMQLQAGSILKLEKHMPAQVSIYANNKMIGAGEVVEIDGQIGVQITHLD